MSQVVVPAATRSVIAAVEKTTFQVGTYNSTTDAFTSVVDLNDHASFWLVKVDMPQPEKIYARSSTIRTQGERITNWNYKNRHVTLSLHLLYQSGTQALLTAIRSLLSAIENPPYRIALAPPNGTALTYADVVAVKHNIPTDAKLILAKAISNVTIDFETAPGFSGDRVTLSNLVVNPGFEAGSGPAITVFNDTYANLNAYAVQAGGALTTDKAYYSGTVLADSPLRYYRLDETSGATAYDAGSGNVNGTTGGSPTQGVTGLLTGDADTCYTFAAASSQYVASASTGLPTAANAPVTLEVWMKFAANPAAGQFVACVGDRGTAGHLIAITLNTTGTITASVSSVVVTSVASLTTGVAHHICAVFDGTTLHLYVDGTQVGTGSAATLTLSYVGTAPFCIGAASTGTGFASPSSFFSGQVDEVAFYGSALSGTRISAHYTAGSTSPSTAANTVLLASGNRVSFGSPAWGAISGWTTRFRYFTGAVATFYLHYTDANNYLAAVVTATTLTLNHVVAGATHALGSTSMQLINGIHYWLVLTQFPCAPGSPSAVQARIYDDGMGASIGTLAGGLTALLGPYATFDAVTALSGAPQIAVSGASLGLGGPYSNVHTMALYGPGGWSTADTLSSGSYSPNSYAWEQNTANTYTGGAVTSYGAGRVDLAPAGLVNAAWAPASPVTQYGHVVKTAGDVLAAAAYVKSSGLGASAVLALNLYEYDSSGTYLRQTTIASHTGNLSAWTKLAGTVTTGVNCAFAALLLNAYDTSAPGASANGIVWWDNAQVWDETTTGQTVMPYCELRFAQSPAQLLVTGLQGDMVAPAHIAWGTYLASWATGSSITYAIGRRAQSSANARMVGETLGYYGAALTPTTTPILSTGALNGFYASASVNPGWNPRAFSFAPADMLGVYHLLHRFWTAQTAGNLPNQSVRAVAEEKSGAWYGAVNGSDVLGGFNGAYITGPLSASSTWTIVDAGQFNIPMFPVGALTDLAQNFVTPRPQWTDSTGGGSTCHCDWQLLLPVDASVLIGTVYNPSNATFAVTAEWLWGYVDGLRAALGEIINGEVIGEGATYSIEAAALPNAGRAAGGPGNTTTGYININNNADPYLSLDPNASTAAAVGVNQLAGYAADNSTNTLALHTELQYTPLYLYPREQ